jgi:phage baseplate assembly protein W
MALEKNLYKNLRVTPQKQNTRPLLNKSYRGLSSVDTNTKETAIYDIALIKQDIVNHFHIRFGEKLENPDFGTIIWDLLWEPFTDNIKTAVQQNVVDIINSDPRVAVTNLTVDTFEHGIQVACTIEYLEYSISEELQLNFDRNNGIN